MVYTEGGTVLSDLEEVPPSVCSWGERFAVQEFMGEARDIEALLGEAVTGDAGAGQVRQASSGRG